MGRFLRVIVLGLAMVGWMASTALALVVHADRVWQTTLTTGTGTYSLSGVANAFRTFVAGVGDGNQCYYVCTDGTRWEVGLGTVQDLATDTLSRDQILASSNAGAAVSWVAGTKDLWVDLPAAAIEKFVRSDATDVSGWAWVVDEDAMTSNSATKVPTQQSVKAYVDAKIAELQSVSNVYYVDATTGNDSNTGSIAAPWQHCPGMTGWAGTATLSAGDTVYFDSADTWTGGSGLALLDAVGGVTYDGASWGGGTKAKLQATGTFTLAIVNINDDDAVHETKVTGFDIDGNGTENTGANVNWPNLAHLTGADKIIDNCEIHNLDMLLQTPTYYGIKVGAAGEGATTQNVRVTNNNVHDINSSGIVVYAQIDCAACTIDSVLVDGNTIGPNIVASFDHNGTGLLFKNRVFNSVASNNTIYDADNIGLLFYQDAAIGPDGCDNITVSGNTISGGLGHGISVQTPAGCDITFYDNLVYGTPAAGLNMAGTSGAGTTVEVDNNLFYGNAYGSVQVINANPVVTLTQNIFSETVNQPNVTTGGATFTPSQNVYYRADSGTAVNVLGTAYGTANINDWDATGVYADPLLTNPPTDFTLQAGSPAIALGAGLVP